MNTRRACAGRPRN